MPRTSPHAARNAAPGLLRRIALAVVFLAPAVSPGQPQDGQVFKDWTARCEVPAGAETDVCYIFQNLVLKEGGQRLLHLAIGYLNDDKPAAIFTLPLGISLPPGVTLQIDEGEERRFQVERCHARGCIAALALDDRVLGEFRAGAQARVTFNDGTRRAVSVPVSLKGFTAGFESLR